MNCAKRVMRSGFSNTTREPVAAAGRSAAVTFIRNWAVPRKNAHSIPGFISIPGLGPFPYPHHAALDYCKKFGVRLEPFIQVNYNALVHSTKAFGGKPQIY